MIVCTTRLLFGFIPRTQCPALYEFVAEACGASALIDGRDWRDLPSGSIDAAFV